MNKLRWLYDGGRMYVSSVKETQKAALKNINKIFSDGTELDIPEDLKTAIKALDLNIEDL